MKTVSLTKNQIKDLISSSYVKGVVSTRKNPKKLSRSDYIKAKRVLLKSVWK